jgi:hypothetical protein
VTRILYITGATGADYMADLVMHGLRSLLGPDLVDVKKMWFMYDTSEHYMFHTLYKLLPDIEVDREDIQGKIAKRYFDAVVYGSVHRCRDYLDSVCSVYPKSRIAFIDGEDGPEVAPAMGSGWYFKRELQGECPGVLPIQFGVPKEKIRPIDLSRKTRLMAHCDPRDRATYVYYDSETRYYDQYADAWFGYTMKKGGWDAMRHHEIIAAGALPYFADFDQCPAGTLATFERDVVNGMRRLCDEWESDGLVKREKGRTNLWNGCMALMRKALLTTEDLARLVLERVT